MRVQTLMLVLVLGCGGAGGAGPGDLPPPVDPHEVGRGGTEPGELDGGGPGGAPGGAGGGQPDGAGGGQPEAGQPAPDAQPPQQDIRPADTTPPVDAGPGDAWQAYPKCIDERVQTLTCGYSAPPYQIPNRPAYKDGMLCVVCKRDNGAMQAGCRLDPHPSWPDSWRICVEGCATECRPAPLP